MGEVSDLIAAASSPADLAVVLVAGTTGLVVDATVTAFGFPSPAIAAFAFAGGALGIKKSADAFWARLRAPKGRKLNVLERAEELHGILREMPAEIPPSGALSNLEINIGLRQRGIITDEDLEVELSKAVDEFRQDQTVRRSLAQPSSLMMLPPGT